MKYFLMAFISVAFVAGAAMAADVTPSVVTGGVGESGRERLEEKEAAFNLKLILVGDGGMYLSDVRVVITDKSGAEVVNTASDGPYVLAQLPAGKYHVTATIAGLKQKTTVSLGNTLKTYYIRFPIKDNVDSDL